MSEEHDVGPAGAPRVLARAVTGLAVLAAVLGTGLGPVPALAPASAEETTLTAVHRAQPHSTADRKRQPDRRRTTIRNQDGGPQAGGRGPQTKPRDRKQGGSGDDTTTVRLPDTVTAAAGTQHSQAVTLPPGVYPIGITARLDTQVVPGARVSTLVDGRVVETFVPRRRARVYLPVDPRQVDGRSQVSIGVAYAVGGSRGQCRSLDPATTTLSDIRFRFGGKVEQPQSLSTFFPDLSPRIDVVVPQDAGDDLLEAGLVAVAAASSRYGPDTTVDLLTDGDDVPDAGPGQRIITIRRASSVGVTIDLSGGTPELRLAGSGDELVSAARALASDDLRVADSPTLEDLGASRMPAGATARRPLSAVTDRDLTLDGYGTTTLAFQVVQDVFGQPISGLTLHLVGTHTALPPGGSGQLDVRVNGRLVGSQSLTNGSRVDLDAAVPASLLRSGNEVELSTTATPGGDGCLRESGQLPFQLQVDSTSSTLTARPGPADAEGFAVWPQVLGGRLPVALRGEGGQRVQAAQDAAVLVAELQRLAARPLDVSLVSVTDLLDSRSSGLLVDADYSDSAALDAPLPLSGTRELTSPRTRLRLASDQPFAALEAFEQGGRHVLMLGTWTRQGTTPDQGLVGKLLDDVERRGWSALTDDALVATPDSDVFALDASTVAPVEEDGSAANPFIVYFLIGIAALLLVLLVQVVAARRRAAHEAPAGDVDTTTPGAVGPDPYTDPYDVHADPHAGAGGGPPVWTAEPDRAPYDAAPAHEASPGGPSDAPRQPGADDRPTSLRPVRRPRPRDRRPGRTSRDHGPR